MNVLKPMKKITILVLIFLFHSGSANEYPEFTGPSSVRIAESLAVNDEVFSFTVADPDEDPLTVSMNYDRKFGLSETSTNQYLVYLKQELDREQESRYILTITIDDSQGGVLRPDIILRLTDVNDFVPVFRNLPLVAYIRENQPAGSFVQNISVKDEDSGYNAASEVFMLDSSLPFYLGDPASKEPMEHSYNGATVLLKEPLDFERNTVFLVSLRVTDVAGCATNCQIPLSSNQTLVVNVIDVQDTPPYFTGLPYVALTEENRPAGTEIIRVSAHDGDAANPRDVQYSLQGADGEVVGQAGLFQINPDNGVVSNSDIIDSDSTEVLELGLSHTLTVVAQEVLDEGETFNSSLHQATTYLTITINDLNDHRPTFEPSEPMDATLSEDTPAGTRIAFAQPLAVMDTDQGWNGTMELKAVNLNGSPSTLFTVSPSVVVNQANITVTTKHALDYESGEELQFKIQAKELSMDYTTEIPITVTLTDVNDNNPQFTQAVYTGTVPENSRSSTEVVFSSPISATDDDSGVYGEIQYSLLDGEGRFEIDADTATLRVTCSICLDRETQSEYRLNVFAEDMGGLTDSAQIVVTLGDVNDNAPTFLQEVYTVYIDEAEELLAQPVTITAEDLDYGLNGEVSYQILTWQEYFSISSNGSLSLIQPLDADTLPELLIITIRGSDSGEPQMSTNTTLRVYVKDLNDNAPEFVQPPALLQIAENTEIGEVIGSIRAVDSDRTSPNNEVTYLLVSGGFGDFMVHATSGEIRVLNRLDRDGLRDEYTLSVRAIDRGMPQLSAQHSVIIKVTDVNDEDPAFLQPRYQFYTSEASQEGSVVGRVTALDPDMTASLIYRIIGIQNFNMDGALVETSDLYVSVNGNSGNITVNLPLDRETVAKIRLEVQVEDRNGDTSQTTTCVVELQITDENDSPPRLMPAGLITITESDSNSLVPISVIHKFTVVDHDISNNLEFTISNNPYGIFSINNQGELRFAKKVDREEVGNWVNITVVVYDDITDGLSASLDVPIYVKDVNDNAPQFTRFQSVVAIPEDKPVNSVITVVTAVDNDFTPDFSMLTYRISNGSLEKFTINRITGEVSIVGDLDRDTMQTFDGSYTLEIMACDQGILPLCTVRNMVIRILDINDNDPVFTQRVYTARISERARRGDEVTDIDTMIHAIDIDSAPNGQNVEYTCCLPTNDSNGLFSISETGYLTVAQPDLQGKVGVYNLTVHATDWGTQRRSANPATVIIRVVDYNDHEPVLRVTGNSGTIVHMAENSTMGMAVILLYAIDGDTGANGQVDFMFVESSADLTDYQHFYITRTAENQAAVRLNTTLDVENKKTTYRFGVQARDRGSPPLSSSTLIVTVNVDDVNDNRPYFPSDKLIVKTNIREDAVGVTLETLDFAVDADSRQVFCYHIVGARYGFDELDRFADEATTRQTFEIIPSTAEVRLRAGESLDRELSTEFVLVIFADDSDSSIYSNCKEPVTQAWISARQSANQMELHITVEDIVDTAPEFSQSTYYAAAVRGRSPGVIFSLKNRVKDADLDQTRTFSGTVQSGVPITVTPDGEIRTHSMLDSNSKGVKDIVVRAADSAGYTGVSLVKIVIINEENLAEVVLARDMLSTEENLLLMERSFKSAVNWTIGVESVRPSGGNSLYTSVRLFVFPQSSSSDLTLGGQILRLIETNPELRVAFSRYGLVSTNQLTASTAASAPESTIDTTITIIVILSVVLVAVLIVLVVICFIMRNKYRRKLKAAHAMVFDTHTLGFEIDQGDLSSTVNQAPDSNKVVKPGPNQVWDKSNGNLNNFDWGNANGGFDSESNSRNHHSGDDNAVDPLNSAETQSCSSGGSNDWRLDIRGNNVGVSPPICTPPPPPVIDMDIPIHTGHGLHHHNHINASSPLERKFTDSGSDRSSCHKDLSTFKSRLVKSDSVYGKVYETRKMPNGLETTEV